MLGGHAVNDVAERLGHLPPTPRRPVAARQTMRGLAAAATAMRTTELFVALRGAQYVCRGRHARD